MSTNTIKDMAEDSDVLQTVYYKTEEYLGYSINSCHANENVPDPISLKELPYSEPVNLDDCLDDHDLHKEHVDSVLDACETPVCSFSSVVFVNEGDIEEKLDDVPLNLEYSCIELKADIRSLETCTINVSDLGLHCVDDTTDKKTESFHLPRTDEEFTPLDVNKFLKLNPDRVPSQNQQVYMLGTATLTAPVAESSKSPTDDSSLPQNCHEEMTRLLTYTEYPIDCPVFVVKLAANGFVYRPTRRTVDCYACYFSIPVADLYKPGFDPVSKHCRMKPDCSFIQGAANNVLFPNWDKADAQQQEMIHYNSVPEVSPKIAVVMPQPNGIDKKDSVINVNHAVIEHKSYEMHNQALLSEHKSYTIDCAPSIEQPHTWPQSQQQKAQHERVNVTLGSGNTGPRVKNCESLPAISETNSRQEVPRRSNSSGNSSNLTNTTINPVTQGAGTQPKAVSSGTMSDNNSSQPKEKKKLTYSDLGIYAEKPKRADMAVMAKRIQSFQGHWNKNLTQTPDMLAEAGMYYAGYADCARCFFCGGGLKNWEAPDNPWIEHARWFPKCTYLRMCKGPLFVEIVQRKNKEKEDITVKDVEQEIALKITEKPIVNSGNKNTLKSGQPVVAQTAPAAFKTLTDVSELEAENEELKSQVTCKICMDEESSVVFLPCGHLVACTHCAIALKNCPLCRSEIKGSVKAHMS